MQTDKSYAKQKNVFRFFEEISKIPRRSYVTAPIAEYLCDFAKARGLAYLRDSADNVIIKKAASAANEHAPTVILQAHTDMVFVTAEPKYEKNAEKGLTLVKNGDFLSAEGTSLGGDDGIGVAYILAVLDDTSLTHPPIEAVFTSNEEVGLLGASALDLSALMGRMLINLDSDTEGVFTVGCAGGSNATLIYPIQRPRSLPCYTLSVLDLPGGHSGMNIADGIPNAILLGLDILYALAKKHPVFLSDIRGGEAHNAIPTFAHIRFSCDEDHEKTESFCKELFSKICNFGHIEIKKAEAFPCMDEKESMRMMQEILSLPNGIQAMEKDFSDAVETSLNLGMIRTEADALTLSYALRSSIDPKREALECALTEQVTAYGGKSLIDGVYPSWEYRKDSPLREACLASYRALYGVEARVDVIHAGLECGIFASGLAGMDAISFGPTNLSIHTAQERLSVSSTIRTYDLILKILSACAKESCAMQDRFTKEN